jgi:hypothetical protein
MKNEKCMLLHEIELITGIKNFVTLIGNLKFQVPSAMRPPRTQTAIFNWVFSQFATLQIIKSLKSGVLFDGFSLQLPIITSLIMSAVFVMVWDPNCSVMTRALFCSFIVQSCIDGSLSNHVFTSVMLALTALFARNNFTVSVRWFCAVLYLVTGIHKLNKGFFDLHYSCASLYTAGAMAGFPTNLVGSSEAILKTIVAGAPYCAVVFELLWPVLLVFSNGRIYRLTVAIGCVFHAMLALPPSPLSVYPFSAIMIPLYVMLCPNPAVLTSNIQTILESKALKTILMGCIAWGWSSAGSVLVGESDLFEYPNYGMWGISVVWNIFWWSLILFSCFSRPASTKFESRYPSATAVPILLILVVFAMSPYVGLRTYPALAMFSNLRTEGRNPNHFFPSFDLFGYQSDYVRVLDTNVAPLVDLQIDLGSEFPDSLKSIVRSFNLSSEFYICPPRWTESKPRIFRPFNVPFVEVRRRVQSMNRSQELSTTNTFIEFIRYQPGKTSRQTRFNLSDSELSHEIFTPLNWFEETFVRFRSFDDEYSPCRH